MPEKTLRWQQAQAHLIESWEFQFQRVGSDEWEGVLPSDPVVDNCVECFRAVVELPETALLVRARAVGPEGTSPWSEQLPVYLPEPGFAAALFLSVLWFVMLGWASRRF